MLKRLTVAVAALFALVAPAFAAGTIPGFSLTPQFDLTGRVAPGCKLYVIQAGTVSTPQNPYSDSGLTILLPNPLTCDASGRLPQWFVADGSIKVRLTKSDGTQIFVGDNLLVVGASSGGGGGSPVDPTTVLTTGDIKPTYGTGNLTGFVRLNGRTIGSATSGATERANSDVQALFQYLWNTDSALAVSGGRGVSASADWSANKTIALPDFRSRSMAGLGDMGNSDNLLFSGITFTRGGETVLGSQAGSAFSTLITGNLPPYTPAGSLNMGAVIPATGGSVVGVNVNNAGTSTAPAAGSGTWNGIGPTIAGFVGSPQGGTSSPFASVSPVALVTFYIKL